MPGEQDAIPQQPFAVDHGQQQSSGPMGHHTKRRQYAAGQTQAYQGTAETVPQYADHAGPVQPAGGQLFTPGVSNEGFHQPQQAPYFAPAEAQYGQPATAMPPYQQQAAPMAQLGDQFGQMNLAGGSQKPVGRSEFSYKGVLSTSHSSIHSSPQISLDLSPTHVNSAVPLRRFDYHLMLPSRKIPKQMPIRRTCAQQLMPFLRLLLFSVNPSYHSLWF